MLTGTPLDLTPFGSLLSTIGLLYWAVVLAAACTALWAPKSWLVKFLMLGVVASAFVLPVAWHVYERQAERNAAQARLQESMALFKERCKSAGERIVRMIPNVNGIVWMKWRKEEKNFSKQFELDDPYGRNCGGENCIASLLRLTSGAALDPEEAKRHPRGYRFVETTDPRNEQLLRYTAKIGVIGQRTLETLKQAKKNMGGKDPGLDIIGFRLDREPIEKYSVRYGLTWDDISTLEDREHWIAGGSQKIVDLQTNEVIAESIGYMIDHGQGSQAGFRSPWLEARQTACPEFPLATIGSSRRTHTLNQTRDFVFKVLKPEKGD